MTTISSKTILRSRNLAKPDKVASTLLLRYPRWIHAEGRTHRLLDIGEDFAISVPTPSLMECDDLSRNAASSRAIPVEKLIQDILDDPAVPLFWGANQKGMQATVECDELVGCLGVDPITGHWSPTTADRKTAWLRARDLAIESARGFAAAGYHKQIVNRLLEPFSHITVLVTATEWSNFLALRDHADAEPHIAMLAREIRKCLDNDPVQDLQPGQWHLPFVTGRDFDDALWAPDEIQQGDMIKLSVARSASTSYKTVDGFDMTLDRAIALHDRLVVSAPLHASPAEHQCQADEWENMEGYGEEWVNPSQHGNLVGFRQYRKMLPGECL